MLPVCLFSFVCCSCDVSRAKQKKKVRKYEVSVQCGTFTRQFRRVTKADSLVLTYVRDSCQSDKNIDTATEDMILQVFTQ
jgi:hypothetical protein